MIFLPIESKNVSWSMRRCKDEGLKMGLKKKKKGFARMIKNSRICRDILRDGRNQV